MELALFGLAFVGIAVYGLRTLDELVTARRNRKAPALTPVWLERVRAERVRVHTVDSQTIEGSVREVGSDGLVLAAAVLVEHNVSMAGDVWVPREKVLMVQSITGAAG